MKRPRRIYVIELSDGVLSTQLWTSQPSLVMPSERLVTFIEQLPKPAKKRRKR